MNGGEHMLELVASVSAAATHADALFWIGVALTTLASTFITISELHYMRNILAGRAHPPPVAWLGWTIGAGLVLYGAFADTSLGVATLWDLLAGAHTLAKESVAVLLNLAYMTVIFVCTGLITWLAFFVGEGRKHVGVRELLCIAIFLGSAGALIADFAGIIAVPWWGPWVAFSLGMLIDFSAWYPLYRGVIERPQDEAAQLWPWRLTVWSAGVNLIALVPNSYVAGSVEWTAVAFALYYYVANTLVLNRLEMYRHRRVAPGRAVPAE